MCQSLRGHFQISSFNDADIVFYPVKEMQWDAANGIFIPDPYVTLPTFAELPTCATDIQCINSPYARAAYPANLNIGKWVVIPSCLSGDLTLSQKTNIVAHEIGHALGFRHSDYGCSGNEELAYVYDCPDIPVWGANHLFGTPTCDVTSLMYSSSQNNTFTDNDRKAACMLYPSGLPPSISYVLTAIQPNNTRVWTVYFSNPLPWYLLRLRLKNATTNQVVKLGNVVPGNSSYATISYNISGNYNLQVMGISYQGEDFGYYCYSANKPVTIP